MHNNDSNNYDFNIYKSFNNCLLYVYNIINYIYCENSNFNIIYNYTLDNECGIRDVDNKMICLFCLENIEKDKITLIQCNKCNKYIGHIYCIYKYIIHNKGHNIKCLNCLQ